MTDRNGEIGDDEGVQEDGSGETGRCVGYQLWGKEILDEISSRRSSVAGSSNLGGV